MSQTPLLKIVLSPGSPGYNNLPFNYSISLTSNVLLNSKASNFLKTLICPSVYNALSYLMQVSGISQPLSNNYYSWELSTQDFNGIKGLNYSADINFNPVTKELNIIYEQNNTKYTLFSAKNSGVYPSSCPNLSFAVTFNRDASVISLDLIVTVGLSIYNYQEVQSTYRYQGKIPKTTFIQNASIPTAINNVLKNNDFYTSIENNAIQTVQVYDPDSQGDPYTTEKEVVNYSQNFGPYPFPSSTNPLVGLTFNIGTQAESQTISDYDIYLNSYAISGI